MKEQWAVWRRELKEARLIERKEEEKFELGIKPREARLKED